MKRLNSLFSLLLAACAGLFLFPLGMHALWDSDEGRYAEIAREMVASHQWLVPHLNNVLYFEKPPLAYWLTAFGLRLFGENPFGARFFSALCGLLTVALVYRIGRTWKNERTGLLAGGMLATSLAFFALTQYLVVDMVLTFWLILALEASLHLVTDVAPEKIRRHALIFALGVAGAFLTKGLIGMLIPGSVLVLTLLIQRMPERARQIPWISAFLLFLFLALPWFILVNHRHPFFLSFFFIHEHFARYFTSVHQRNGPIYYFIPVLLVGFLPWVFFLPRTGVFWLKNRAVLLRQDSRATMLFIWASFIFVLFSFSSSKLPAYMLPVFPAFALLTAAFLDERFDESPMSRWMSWAVDGWIVFILLIIGLLKWMPSPEFLQQPPASFIVENGASLAISLALCTLVLVGVWGMRQTAVAFGGLLITQVLFLSGLTALAPQLDPWFSTQRLGQLIAARGNPQDPVIVYGVSYETYVQTLAFYTQRRIAIYGPLGEFALGAAHAADAALWFAEGDKATEALTQAPAGAWVVTNDEYENQLAAAGLLDQFVKVEASGRLHLLQKIQ